MIAYSLPADCTAAASVQYLQLVDPVDAGTWSWVRSYAAVPVDGLSPAPRLGWHDCHAIPRDVVAPVDDPRARRRTGHRGGERGLGVRNFAKSA